MLVLRLQTRWFSQAVNRLLETGGSMGPWPKRPTMKSRASGLAYYLPSVSLGPDEQSTMAENIFRPVLKCVESRVPAQRRNTLLISEDAVSSAY